MAANTVELQLKVAWWLAWYLAGAALVCRITGCDPEMRRAAGWVQRAIKVEIV